MYVLKYDSEFHFMTTFGTAFKLPIILSLYIWLLPVARNLLIPALHFKTFYKLFMRLSVSKVSIYMVVGCS